MNKISELIRDSQNIIIAGHVHPDGDCIGSSLGLYNYIKTNYSDKSVKVYLEKLPDVYDYLPGFEEVINDYDGMPADILIALDSGDMGRIGVVGNLTDKALKLFCVDHHISNTGYGDVRMIYPFSSSTSEIIYELIEFDGGTITQDIAKCLYTGIVQDTGLFKFDCTGPRTMEILGKLISTGFDFSFILDRIFFQKTYEHQRLLAKAIDNSDFHDGIITSVITYQEYESINAQPEDLEGIVNTLLNTEGAGVCVFIYPKKNGIYKVSLRAKDETDVSQIAVSFDGGGHKKAAGFDTDLDHGELIQSIKKQIMEQRMKF